jgi:hypothetical protein
LPTDNASPGTYYLSARISDFTGHTRSVYADDLVEINPAANDFDDGAIATDKVALPPGQTGTFANYTSYPRGINGIMVDIQGLADPAGGRAYYPRPPGIGTSMARIVKNWAGTGTPEFVGKASSNPSVGVDGQGNCSRPRRSIW